MSCLVQLGKVFLIYCLLAIFVILCMSSIAYDMIRISKGKEPIFLNNSNIESFEEPIFHNIENKLKENYELNQVAIHEMQMEMIFLPKNKNLKVEFLDDSRISFSANKKGNHSTSININYKSLESREKLEKYGLSSEKIDALKTRMKSTGCVLFEKGKTSSLGFLKAKGGVFHYRFSNTNDDPKLQDSCLIQKFNNRVYFEYKGQGRGPDCIVNKNPEGYDDRSFLRKWYDIITNKEFEGK